jgi:hypothetical protein
MATAQYRPPGDVADMDAIDGARAAWHAAMTVYVEGAIDTVHADLGGGDASQFADFLAHPPNGNVDEAVIVWQGFPKTIQTEHPNGDDALEQAEVLAPGRFRPQDEYLEWHAIKDGDKIVAVDFTCEGPDYWEALAGGYPPVARQLHKALGGAPLPPAKGDLDVVLALYRQYISPDVQPEDLVTEGPGGKSVYDPLNRWNTTDGAMHLTHPSNNLWAEVALAGAATVLRAGPDGEVIEDDDELIGCAKYGEATRASDPTIGGSVNRVARSGALVSLRNPIGLYIDSLDNTGWTTPAGDPVGDYWTVLRGTPDAIVRARYEVPESEGFAVGDIEIGGEKIAYAGQIAEHITMKLTGLAAAGGAPLPAVGCKNGDQPHLLALGGELAYPIATRRLTS